MRVIKDVSYKPFNVKPAYGFHYRRFSDHQLIFCTRKTFIIKTGSVHKHINFRSMKNGRTDDYKKNLRQIVLQLKSFQRRQSCILRFLWKNCVSYRQDRPLLKLNFKIKIKIKIKN